MLYFLDQAEASTGGARWSAAAIIQEASVTFLPTLQFLIDLGVLQHPSSDNGNNSEDFEPSFQANFRLGPHGLQPIIEFFRRLFQLIIAQRYTVPLAEFNAQMDMFNSYTAPLHSLLLHFRTSVDRVEYDPVPFSDLCRELRIGSGKFAVSHFYFV
jgi:hypothetical protein